MSYRCNSDLHSVCFRFSSEGIFVKTSLNLIIDMSSINKLDSGTREFEKKF